MQTYHFHTTVTKEHEVRVPGLPLAPGVEVRVTVELTPKLSSERKFPLRGLPFEYRDPFSPAIDPEEWNAVRDDPA